MKNHAFTLIEVLIVILIIGVLAAIAVQQYKKAVIKSKAAHMQTLLDNVIKASDRYYLQNGEYPKKFEDLDIEINLPSLNGKPCFRDLERADIKQSGDFAIAIHSGNDSNLSINVIAVYFITGKYKCRGFSRIRKWKDYPQEDVTYCMEAYGHLDCGTFCERGIFCKEIMEKKKNRSDLSGQIIEYY